MENFSFEDFFKRIFGGPSPTGNSQIDDDNATARREMMKDADLGWTTKPNVHDFAPASGGDVGGYRAYGQPGIAGPLVAPYAPADQAALYSGADVGGITTMQDGNRLQRREKRGLMGWTV
jgi:hypothetical protein